MDVQKLFWDEVNDTGYLTCPPLTERMLGEAKAQLGFVLPRSFVDVLKVMNGGILRPNRIYVGTDIDTFPDADSEGYIGIPLLFGICRQRGINSLTNGMLFNETLKQSWGYPEKSVVISHAGHGGFALDYTNSLYPEVICVDAEQYPVVLIRTVAPNFEKFLSRLELKEAIL